MVNIFIKYRDYKVRETRIYKLRGLKITKYDRAGLQITIGFRLQSATKVLKIGLQVNGITKCDEFGLQIAMSS